MRRRFWLALDKAGHALPWLRFGRLRYRICLRADRYYSYTETEDMTPEHFDALADAGEPVDIVLAPGFRVVIKDNPFVPTEPGTWATGSASTWTLRPPKPGA